MLDSTSWTCEYFTKSFSIVFNSIVTVDVISTLTVWLTDKHGKQLDLRGEELTIRFHLRERYHSMYVQYKVNVPENQMDTLKDTIRLKEGVTPCFPKSGIRGDHVLLLTPPQINRMDRGTGGRETCADSHEWQRM